MRSFKSKSWQVFAIAILTLMVLGGYTIIQDQNNTVTTIRTATDLQQVHYPMFTSTSDNSVKQVFNLCQKKKFNEALDMINVANSDIQNDPRYLFAKGVCLLNLDQLNDAQEIFSDLVDAGYPFIQDQTMWYLAVTSLKLEQLDKAQSVLEILAGEPTSDFHIEAVNLLKQIDANQNPV